MTPNKENKGCHYLAVKRLSKLLKEITSKHHGDFYRFRKETIEQKKKNLNLKKKYIK